MLKFEVLIGPWTADGREFSDSVEESDPSPELVKLAGSAHAAGVIRVDEGLDTSHVESEDDSHANLVAAMGDWVEPLRDPDTNAIIAPGYWSGPWYEGHAVNQAIDAEIRATKPYEEE